MIRRRLARAVLKIGASAKGVIAGFVGCALLLCLGVVLYFGGVGVYLALFDWRELARPEHAVSWAFLVVAQVFAWGALVAYLSGHIVPYVIDVLKDWADR